MILYDAQFAGSQKLIADLKVVRGSCSGPQPSERIRGVSRSDLSIKFLDAERNERHRDIERTSEISVLYSLLIDHPGRGLGVAPGASGTVGTLSLTPAPK
jgi:hypothetical protein